jgi:hypothetical protein
MNVDAVEFIPNRVKAAIRYVLNPRSPIFNMDDLVWTQVQPGQELVVYRGQCNVSPKLIPRVGDNPLIISTAYGRPISTSLVLNQHIEEFACQHPGGRLFEIHLTPGTKYAAIQNSLKGFAVNRDEVFQFLKDELPVGSFYKDKSLARIRGTFFYILAHEKEIILDPRSIVFVKEPKYKSPETWDKPMVKSVLQVIDNRGKPTGQIRMAETYRTFVAPLAGGRGRSLRTHSARRSKNGRGLTRKSKRRIRNGDA